MRHWNAARPLNRSSLRKCCSSWQARHLQVPFEITGIALVIITFHKTYGYGTIVAKSSDGPRT